MLLRDLPLLWMEWRLELIGPFTPSFPSHLFIHAFFSMPYAKVLKHFQNQTYFLVVNAEKEYHFLACGSATGDDTNKGLAVVDY